MSVPTVVIHVELPAYSTSFDVQVPLNASVFDVKQAISSVCVGHPLPEGQRVIWRGRCLDDQEKVSELWPRPDDQRAVHLSVRPSAWTSDAPKDTTTSSSSYTPGFSAKQSSPTGPQQQSFSDPAPASDENNSFAFIRFKHSQALCWLSNSKLAAPHSLNDLDIKRSRAKHALEQLGYTWPDILDATCPLAVATSANLDYEIITIDGKSYLSLVSPRGTPSPLQVHALNLLTYTFSVLSLPPSRTPLTRITSTSNISPVPQHVNDLLRDLGLPPLRVTPNTNVNATVQPDAAGIPAIPEHAEGNMIREIPMRALLAPLLMVLFRTALLLYFFSPTRKPLLGLCLIAWIVYEMWTHVRIVILRPDRAGGNAAGVGANGAQRGAAGDGAPVVAPVADDNNRLRERNPPRPGGNAPDTEPTRDPQQMPGPPIPRQSNGIVDSLSLANVHNENKLLWPVRQPETIPEPPSFLHKMGSFCSLLVVTLHPEVYNRRRVALRQREGRLRTEMSAVQRAEEGSNGDQVPSEEEQRREVLRQQLQTQHAQRAIWVKRYVERVRRDDWVEE